MRSAQRGFRMNPIASMSVVFVCLLSAPAPAEPVFTKVFAGKEGGYAFIRIPLILQTDQGTLLAFAEGRRGVHDQSSNDTIMKRSTDGGATWSALKTIADDGDNCINMGCVVQDRRTRRIFVFGGILPAGHESTEFRYLSPGMQEYQRKQGRQDRPGIQPGYDGPHVCRTIVIWSDDDGRTWSPIQDITRSAKHEPPALWCMPGPGVGIQLRRGAHAGRLVVPCYQLWLQKEGPSAWYQHASLAVYSDDSGRTWQRGQLARFAGQQPRGEVSSETQMVELDDGSIMLNARGPCRAVGVSKDGGQTWSPLKQEPAMVGKGCAVGFLRYSSAHDGQKSRLLFSGPAEPKRTDGMVCLSYDEGKTWPVSKLLRPGVFCYSGLVRLGDGRVGCILEGSEKGWCILFARFSLEWLTENQDRAEVK
jgi:sialidase-1